MYVSSLGPRQWFMQRRIKLQHLRLLAALGLFPTLHRAAEEINISQPAASKLIADLEDVVQHQLFERKGRAFIPNGLGIVLIRRAQAMLRELEQASEELNALVDGRGGRVVIGAIDGPTVNFLADTLAAMRAEFPFIDIEVEKGSSVRLFEMLSRGEVEVALGRITEEFNQREFSYREIGPEHFAVVGRKGHPLAAGAPLDIAQLQRQDWIVQKRGSTLRSWFDVLFDREGLDLPAHIVNTNSLLMTLAYIDRTDALSVLSAPVARQQAACGQLSLIPVEPDMSGSPYGLILPRERPMSPALQSFLMLFGRVAGMELLEDGEQGGGIMSAADLRA